MREVGLLQPVVVRPLGRGPLRADHGGAAVAGRPGGRPHRHPGDRPRDRRRRPAARRPAGEPAPRQLNPLEEAAAYDQLLQDFGCTHDELAGRIGRSRPQISNTLRLLKLPPPVQRRVAAGVLSAGHARALLGLDDPAAQERLAAADRRRGPLGPRRSRRSSPSGGDPAAAEPDAARPPAGGAEARGPRRPAVRPVRDPGQGRPRPVQGPDRRGVRARSTTWSGSSR